jgi:hypothetical protein
VDPFHQIRSAAGSGPRSGNPQLARLLEWGYGYRRDNPCRRRAPSAGALYPCELLTIEHGTAGWRCFLYDFRRHRRIWLPATDATAAARIMRLSRHQAAVIVVAALWRSVQRYGARSYRYCALDAGHIMGNLSRVASRTTGPPAWRVPAGPELPALLALPGSAVALAAGVFDVAGLDVPPAPLGSVGREAARAPGKASGLRDTQVPEETPLVSPQLLRVQRFHERVQACADALVAAPPGAPVAELFTILEARRSAKDFLTVAPNGLPPQPMAAVTEYFTDAAPGAGQILPLATQRGWRRPAGTLTQADLSRICVHQDLVSRVGAAFLLTCPSPGQPDGSFDHGEFLRACMRAGMVSAELYRLATSLRLASTMIGGFLDSAMLPACQPGRYPLALQVFGRPADGARRKADAALMVAARA